MSDREIMQAKYGTSSYDQSGIEPVLTDDEKQQAYSILSRYDEQAILLAAKIINEL